MKFHDEMPVVTRSLDATSVFHQCAPPSSSPLCDSGTPHHQAAEHITTQSMSTMLAVWLSGNVLASINVVALRQTRLVPGRVNHLSM